jgi:hypothetical protein
VTLPIPETWGTKSDGRYGDVSCWLFGHGAMSDLSPLSGAKRKLDFRAVRAAFYPTRTWPGNFAVTHKTLPFGDVLECLLDLREDL